MTTKLGFGLLAVLAAPLGLLLLLAALPILLFGLVAALCDRRDWPRAAKATGWPTDLSSPVSTPR